jgi:hypothetical protein
MPDEELFSVNADNLFLWKCDYCGMEIYIDRTSLTSKELQETKCLVCPPPQFTDPGEWVR